MPGVSDAAEFGARRTGRWRWILVAMIPLVILGISLAARNRQADDVLQVEHPVFEGPLGQGTAVSMAEVLVIAEDALETLRKTIDDYTAVMTKQERIHGRLTEPAEMEMKVQCRHRGGGLGDDLPLRVYLRFLAPTGVAGREVLWAEDLHDGQMIVREAGVLGMFPVRLDPDGIIAMRGQKYPISEIGLTRLVEKLIERGRRDLDDPDISVTMTRSIEFDSRLCDRIVVTRARPGEGEDNFSRAEIWFDSERKLPLRYFSFGWPDDPAIGDASSSSQARPTQSVAPDGADAYETGSAPLLESYSYRNIQTNVGLSERDFDPANPEYRFQ